MKMRPSFLAPALVLITSFAPSTTALKASTSSPCAAQCGNELGSTAGSDVVCSNADYKALAPGVVFQTCISCQLESQYVDPVTKQSDLHWAICKFLAMNSRELSEEPIANMLRNDRQLTVCCELVFVWISGQEGRGRYAMYDIVCHQLCIGPYDT